MVEVSRAIPQSEIGVITAHREVNKPEDVDKFSLHKYCAFRVEIHNLSHALLTTRDEIKRVLEMCSRLRLRDKGMRDHQLICAITERWAIFRVETWTYGEGSYRKWRGGQ